jgi:hypothetical protein
MGGTVPRLSRETLLEVLRMIRARNAGASTEERRCILDQFVALTGYHRTHAIRVVHATTQPISHRPRVSRRVYDEAVREALTVLWEASDRVCGKRLRGLVPVLLPALERHGHLKLDEFVRKRLLKVSAATIDRVLVQAREAPRARRARSGKTGWRRYRGPNVCGLKGPAPRLRRSKNRRPWVRSERRLRRRG